MFEAFICCIRENCAIVHSSVLICCQYEQKKNRMNLTSGGRTSLKKTAKVDSSCPVNMTNIHLFFCNDWCEKRTVYFLFYSNHGDSIPTNLLLSTWPMIRCRCTPHISDLSFLQKCATASWSQFYSSGLEIFYGIYIFIIFTYKWLYSYIVFVFITLYNLNVHFLFIFSFL